MQTECIKIANLDVNDNKLLVYLSYPKKYRKYFLSNLLEIEYSKDLKKVPKSILYIPAVSSIITVAWAIGSDIFVEELDHAFLDSLRKIKDIFHQHLIR